jgi:FkbM family methyltransferase
MKIGKFDLLVPPQSPLYETYRDNPKLNSELGRIASSVYTKYPEMVSVDVGANIGDTAAIIRSVCPAPIVCVDGDELLGHVLAENIRMLGDATVVQVYLSDNREEQHVCIQKEGWNNTLLPVASEGRGKQIRFLPLDDALKDIDLHRVKLLKIDTEGFDARVLRGSRNILKIGRPVVIFEYNRENLSPLSEDGLSIFAGLKNHGYHSALFWDDRGRFLLGTSLNDMTIIEDLHDYVDFREKPLGYIYYLDICLFHECDQDLAEKCLAAERRAREQE